MWRPALLLAILQALTEVAAAQSTLWVYPEDSTYAVQRPIWKKVAGAEIYYNAGPVRQPVGPGNVSTCWSISGSCVHVGPLEGEWMTVDLTLPPWSLPADAAWAEMRGIGGHSGGPASAGVIYRRPGDMSVTCDSPNFAVQFMSEVISSGSRPDAPSLGGTRQNGTVRVPLDRGRYEFCWRKSYLWNNATFFWNASVVAWGRGE